jgi:hypothetical protein
MRMKILKVTLEVMRRILTNDEVDDSHELDYAADYSLPLLDFFTPTTIPLPFCRLRVCMFYL